MKQGAPGVRDNTAELPSTFKSPSCIHFSAGTGARGTVGGTLRLAAFGMTVLSSGLLTASSSPQLVLGFSDTGDKGTGA